LCVNTSVKVSVRSALKSRLRCLTGTIVPFGVSDNPGYGSVAADTRPLVCERYTSFMRVALDSLRTLQALISAGALLIALAHLIWPQVKIDAITIALIVIAIVPWLAPLFKSLELPGGVKLEFQELQRATIAAQQAGLLPSETIVRMPEDVPKRPEALDADKYTFQVVANVDPNLALAGLRIEIEKRLFRLAVVSGIEPRRRGMGGLLRDLRHHDVLGRQEQDVLERLSVLLNNAVHGALVDERGAAWAADVGPPLLEELDRRIARAESPASRDGA
jgi:hypothetical protein